MNTVNLSELSDEQLVHRELNSRRELAAHQLRHATGKLENNSLLGKTRRSIARMQGEIRRRELEGQMVGGTLRSRHLGSYVPAALSAAPEAGGSFLKNMLDSEQAPE
jgi:ribosomal protein L29